MRTLWRRRSIGGRRAIELAGLGWCGDAWVDPAEVRAHPPRESVRAAPLVIEWRNFGVSVVHDGEAVT